MHVAATSGPVGSETLLWIGGREDSLGRGDLTGVGKNYIVQDYTGLEVIGVVDGRRSALCLAASQSFGLTEISSHWCHQKNIWCINPFFTSTRTIFYKS